jgi:hypothetical protein
MKWVSLPILPQQKYSTEQIDFGTRPQSEFTEESIRVDNYGFALNTAWNENVTKVKWERQNIIVLSLFLSLSLN